MTRDLYLLVRAGLALLLALLAVVAFVAGVLRDAWFVMLVVTPILLVASRALWPKRAY